MVDSMEIFKNKKYFIMALGIAMFLWLYVKLGFTTRQVIGIPLKVINVPEGYVLVSDLPKRIPVQIESEGKNLLAMMYLYDVAYELDFEDYRHDSVFYPGRHPENIHLPSKGTYRILGVNYTDSLILKTEKLVKKKIPIRPNVRITCSSGFVVVGGLKVKPDSVMAVFPESYSDRITHLSTDSAAYSDLNSHKTFFLKVLPSSDHRVHYNLDEVEVNVNVQPLGEFQMDNLPIKILNLPPNIRAVVQPSTFSIRLRGGVNYLASLPKDSIRGYIDYKKEKTLRRPEPQLIIEVPKDITWSQISPSRFRLVELED